MHIPAVCPLKVTGLLPSNIDHILTWKSVAPESNTVGRSVKKIEKATPSFMRHTLSTREKLNSCDFTYVTIELSLKDITLTVIDPVMAIWHIKIRT